MPLDVNHVLSVADLHPHRQRGKRVLPLRTPRHIRAAHNPSMCDPLRQEEIESRWEAAPAVAIVIGLQLLLGLVSRAEA
jgi:hypothetical protein